MKVFQNIILSIASTFLMFISIILFSAGIAEKITGMAITGLIIFLGSLFIVIKVGKNNIPEGKRINYKEQIKLNKQKTLEKEEKRFRKTKYKFKHTLGLPIMPGAICEVMSLYDNIIITAQATKFEIDKNKIVSISKQKCSTEQLQAISSAGGAVSGAMLFGSLGAAIGGRTKVKKIKDDRYYLVITYINSTQETKYIIFDYELKGESLIKDFNTYSKKDSQPATVKID